MENKPFSVYEFILVGLAISELGQAVGTHNRDSVLCRVTGAVRQLNQFLGNALPAPELTESQQICSGNIHTYLRKYCDTPNATAIYLVVEENRAPRIWASFVQKTWAIACSDKKDAEVFDLLEEIRREDSAPTTTDDSILFALLDGWEEFQNLIKKLREWNGY